jgi:hypothetical protein
MADVTWKGNDATTPNDASVAGNWTTAPTTSDNVRFTALYTNALTAGVSSLTATTLGQVVIEHGYSGTIGTPSGALQIQCSQFIFKGSGNAAVDLQTSGVDAVVHGTDQSFAAGLRGIYIQGSALTSLIVQGGAVGLAYLHGESSTVATVRVTGGDLICGDGVDLSSATVEVYGGSCELRSNVATVKVYGGSLVLAEDSDVTTLQLFDGSVRSIGSGDITTATLHGGLLDMRGGVSRTITTLNLNPGGSVSYDPNAITLTTQNEPDAPISISTSPR